MYILHKLFVVTFFQFLHDITYKYLYAVCGGYSKLMGRALQSGLREAGGGGHVVPWLGALALRCVLWQDT